MSAVHHLLVPLPPDVVDRSTSELLPDQSANDDDDHSENPKTDASKLAAASMDIISPTHIGIFQYPTQRRHL